jgi:hypothetical protein
VRYYLNVEELNIIIILKPIDLDKVTSLKLQIPGEMATYILGVEVSVGKGKVAISRFD